MVRSWLVAVALLLGAGTFATAGSACSTRPSMTPQERQAYEERQSIERPARGLEEETSLADRIGQVGVVILVVGITLAGIMLPILLL